MKPRPVVTLVAIVSTDGFISNGRGVPWELPRDKAHFRAATAGKWLLVGRTTYEEMLGWFRDHHPLVLTRSRSFVPPIGESVNSVEEALDLAHQGGAEELMAIGGGPTFEAAMLRADRLLITHVDCVLGGGVPFPPILAEEWVTVDREEHPADEENALPMAFVTYRRQKNAVLERFDSQ